MLNNLKGILALIITASVVIPSYAQDEVIRLSEAEDDLLTFQQVAVAPGSAEELFARSRLWIAENYGSTDAVTDFVDEENNVIVVKAIIPIRNLGSKVMIHHLLKIEAREGRARMTVNRFVYQGSVGSPRIAFEKTGLSRMSRRKRMIEKTEEFLTTAFYGYMKYLNSSTSLEEEW